MELEELDIVKHKLPVHCNDKRDLVVSGQNIDHYKVKYGQCMEDKKGSHKIQQFVMVPDGKLKQKCPSCERFFDSKKKFDEHILMHEDLNPDNCSICKESLSETGVLQQHLRHMNLEISWQRSKEVAITKELYGLKDVGMVKYKCPFCEEVLNDKHSYNRHVREHANADKFNCNICNLRFPNARKLQIHKRSESHRKERICKICGKSFGFDGVFINHILLHNGKEAANYCKLCDKHISMNVFKSHLLYHSGQNTHLCKVCGESFFKESYFNTHATKRHLGRKIQQKKGPKCHICGKVYSYHRSLRLHMKVHEGEAPYSCGVCARKFKWRAGYTNHLAKHSQEKPFKCMACPEVLSSDESLKSHILSSHTSRNVTVKKYFCELCPQGYTRRWNLKQHMQTHKHDQGETPLEIKDSNLASIDSQEGEAIKQEPTSEDENEKTNSMFSLSMQEGEMIKTENDMNDIDDSSIKIEPVSYFDYEQNVEVSPQSLDNENKYCSKCNQLHQSKKYCRRKRKVYRKVYSCEFCKKASFEKESDLKVHLQEHENFNQGISDEDIKPFTCIPCGRQFKFMHRFKMHEQSHAQERNAIDQLTKDKE